MEVPDEENSWKIESKGRKVSTKLVSSHEGNFSNVMFVMPIFNKRVL